MVNWTVVAISFIMYIVAAEVAGIGIAGALIIATVLSLIYA